MNTGSQRVLLAFAALWGFVGVIMLAAGSHPPQTGLLAHGGELLLFHAAAVIGLLGLTLVTGWRRALPMILMLAGSGIFAFEIVLHVTTGVLALGILAPIGGSLAILGWLVLAVGAVLEPKT